MAVYLLCSSCISQEKAMSTYEDLIRTQGLEAASREQDARKRAALKETGLNLSQFTQLVKRIARIDEEFRRACTNVLQMSRTQPPSLSILETTPQDETQADWVLRILQEGGGEIYGPQVYDLWEQGGGNRRAIQTTVSKLIRSRKIRKSRKQVCRGRQRGSVLYLRGYAKDKHGSPIGEER